MNFFKLIIQGFNDMGLAKKFGLVTAATLLSLLSLSSAFNLDLQHSSLDSLLTSSEQVVDDMAEARIQANRESELIKARQLLKLLTQIAPSAIAEFDFTGLLNYTMVATEDPDISYAAIINNDGKVLASSGDQDQAANDGMLEQDIIYEEERLGKVILGYNHKRSNQQIARTRENVNTHLQHMAESRDQAYNELFLSQTLLLSITTAIAVGLIYFFAGLVTRPLATAIDVARKIADGDLTAEVDVHSNDETGQLLQAMKAMLNNLQQMVSQIGTATTQLGSTAGQMSHITESTAKGASRQHAETDQLANAIVEMTASAKEVFNNATEAAHAAQQADDESSSGQQVVRDTIQLMNDLAQDIDTASGVIQKLEQNSEAIGTVLDVIRSIAEQTNLLALNAAIEAARAGEQGRGFAVVADEVRTLAGRTQDSTAEIQTMIERLQNGANEAVDVMGQCRGRAQQGVEQAAKAGDSLNAITRSISTISDMNTQIVTAAREQTEVTEELGRNITNISAVASQTADSAQITSDSTEELNQLSMDLVGLVNRFRRSASANTEFA